MRPQKTNKSAVLSQTQGSGESLHAGWQPSSPHPTPEGQPGSFFFRQADNPPPENLPFPRANIFTYKHLGPLANSWIDSLTTLLPSSLELCEALACAHSRGGAQRETLREALTQSVPTTLIALAQL